MKTGLDLETKAKQYLLALIDVYEQCSCDWRDEPAVRGKIEAIAELLSENRVDCSVDITKALRASGIAYRDDGDEFSVDKSTMLEYGFTMSEDSQSLQPPQWMRELVDDIEYEDEDED